MATLPTAAIAASISWSATSTDAAITTMFLKVSEYVISNDAGNFRGKLSTKFDVQHNANYNVDFSIRPKSGIGTKFSTELYSKCINDKLNH
ncbi:hypothetical protein MY1884_002020 [Beauveria asiatica]